jgi:uncharacterized Tic20 family protein
MSIADDLAHLEDQHSQGVLTEAEFLRAKERLLDGDTKRPATEKDERQWGMFVHLSLFGGYIVPLGGLILPIVLWQMKKDEFPSVDMHGRNVMNALLSLLIYATIGGILCLVFVGFFVLFALAICSVVFPIIGALKANDGVIWKYPYTIQFFSVPE